MKSSLGTGTDQFRRNGCNIDIPIVKQHLPGTFQHDASASELLQVRAMHVRFVLPSVGGSLFEC